MITGKTLLVDTLSSKECRALRGRRVVACKGFNETGREDWAIGTVEDMRPRDGIKIWVRFDCIGLLGIFPEESIVVLEEKNDQKTEDDLHDIHSRLY